MASWLVPGFPLLCQGGPGENPPYYRCISEGGWHRPCWSALAGKLLLAQPEDRTVKWLDPSLSRPHASSLVSLLMAPSLQHSPPHIYTNTHAPVCTHHIHPVVVTVTSTLWAMLYSLKGQTSGLVLTFMGP